MSSQETDTANVETNANVLGNVVGALRAELSKSAELWRAEAHGDIDAVSGRQAELQRIIADLAQLPGWSINVPKDQAAPDCVVSPEFTFGGMKSRLALNGRGALIVRGQVPEMNGGLVPEELYNTLDGVNNQSDRLSEFVQHREGKFFVARFSLQDGDHNVLNVLGAGT